MSGRGEGMERQGGKRQRTDRPEPAVSSHIRGLQQLSAGICGRDPRQAQRQERRPAETPSARIDHLQGLAHTICTLTPAQALCAEMQPAMDMLARSLRDLGHSKYELTRSKYMAMRGAP